MGIGKFTARKRAGNVSATYPMLVPEVGDPPGKGAVGALPSQPAVDMANAAISTATTIPAIRPLPRFIAFIECTFRHGSAAAVEVARRSKMLTLSRV